MSNLKTVAVVGAGIGRFHITEGYLNNPDKFRVVAICDLDAEKMTKLADEFGIERRTTAATLMPALTSMKCIVSSSFELIGSACSSLFV